MRGRCVLNGRCSSVAQFARALLRAAFGLVALAFLHGCGSSGSATVDEDKSSENLKRIGAAYSQAALQLGRPPRDANDLSAAIKNSPDKPNPADILRSPADNENYVIVYGVDFRALAMKRGNVDVVIAYEKVGVDGKRLCLKPPAQVVVMTDEEFKSADFPPGHQPAP